MIQVTQSKIIHAPQDQVWSLLSDVTTVNKYHPLVKSVDLLSPNKTGIGATRVCHFEDGTSVTEKVVHDANGRIAFELSNFSLPMKEFDAELSVKPLITNETDLTFTLHFQPKYGFIGKLMGKYVVKPKMKELLRNVMAGVARHLATGETIGKDFRAPKEKE